MGNMCIDLLKHVQAYKKYRICVTIFILQHSLKSSGKLCLSSLQLQTMTAPPPCFRWLETLSVVHLSRPPPPYILMMI